MPSPTLAHLSHALSLKLRLKATIDFHTFEPPLRLPVAGCMPGPQGTNRRSRMSAVPAPRGAPVVRVCGVRRGTRRTSPPPRSTARTEALSCFTWYGTYRQTQTLSVYAPSHKLRSHTEPTHSSQVHTRTLNYGDSETSSEGHS